MSISTKEFVERELEAREMESRERDEARVLSPADAAKMPLHEIIARLREADRCTECGKTRAVMNVARRGFTPEKVSATTHCDCKDGPAYVAPIPAASLGWAHEEVRPPVSVRVARGDAMTDVFSAAVLDEARASEQRVVQEAERRTQCDACSAPAVNLVSHDAARFHGFRCAACTPVTVAAFARRGEVARVEALRQ